MQAKAVEDEEKIKETATTTSSRNRSIKDNEILNHTTATRIVFETNEQPKIIGKIYGRKYSEAWIGINKAEKHRQINIGKSSTNARNERSQGKNAKVLWMADCMSTVFFVFSCIFVKQSIIN